MAPPKSSGGAVQSRLSFPTTKGGVSAAAAKAKKPVVSAVTPTTATSATSAQSAAPKDTVAQPKGLAKAPQKQRKRPVDSDGEEEDDLGFTVDQESEEEVEEPVEAITPAPPVVVPIEVEEISSTSEDDEMEAAKGKAKAKGLKDLMTDRQFKEGYKIAKAKVGGDLTQSAAKESKATTVLRSFDLSYEYGPCVGMTRLERWNRASKLGLDPPEIVRLILETEKEDKLTNEEVDALQQTVFYGKV
ncbi:hypothetical protein FRB90_005357 [Tulasnella sp. 427]|nr:hypothetical protein FRB90_005357 [Tulasnella sp. 427]